MATTRIKDISSTVTSLASDDYVAVDGATNGTRKMVRGSIYTDVASAFTGAPTTYDICPLNSGTGKIDATYLPTSGDTPKGEWNASTNSPSLIDGTGTAGDYYDVTTAGSQDLGSGSITFTVGDVVKYNGSTWYKIDSVANFLDGYSTAATSRTALEVNSIDEDAEATGTKLVGPALYFDGSNDYIEVADDDKLSFTDGTDDLPFTVSAWINMTATGRHPILAKWGTSAANREWLFGVGSSNQLRLDLTNVAGNSPYRLQDASLSGYVGQWIHVAVTYGGAGPNSASAFTAAADEITFYVNGEAVASTANNNGSYDGMADTAQAVWSGREANNYGQHHIRNVQLYNRELTATEVAQLARGNDLGYADEYGGAFGGTETSDFSAGVDGYSVSNGTVDGNIDAIGGQDDNLRLTVNNATAVHRINTPTYLTVGKRYAGHFYYYIPSGQSNVDGASLRFTNGDIIDSGLTTLDAWTKVDLDFIATTAGLQLYATDGGAATFTDAGGDDVLYIRDVKITQIGTLADFRAENYDSDTAKLYDISDNAFVGTGTSVTLTGRAYPYYETGSWTPTLTFGGGSTGLAYTSQEGYYTRIGNTVFATGGLILSAKGSSTGAAAIALPYTARNTTDDIQGVSVGRGLNMASLTSAVSGYIVDNTTSCKLQDWGATGSVDLDEGNFTDTTEINISVTYQIS